MRLPGCQFEIVYCTGFLTFVNDWRIFSLLHSETVGTMA